MLEKATLNLEACDPVSSLESGRERRCRPLLRLALPLVLISPGSGAKIATNTEDVSCDSFYCVSDRPLPLDEELECEIMIPGDAVSSVPEDDLRLRCRARVIRVVPRGKRLGFGIACRLDDFTINRSAAVQ